MPRRHFVSETDELAVELNEVAVRSPELSCLQLLALEGHHAAQQQRLALIEQRAGLFTGTYGPHYLATLREEWPV